MKHKYKARWPLIAGILFAFQTAAQTTADPSTDLIKNTDQTQSASPNEKPTAQKDTVSPAVDAPAPAPAPASAASIIDYEASEQVSEDLSVAFPVDI